MLMFYFYVFAGVFELYGAAGFTNSIIVLHIPPHYSKYKYMEGRYKVSDASGLALGHAIATGVLYVSLNGITERLRHSSTKSNIVIIKKKY